MDVSSHGSIFLKAVDGSKIYKNATYMFELLLQVV